MSKENRALAVRQEQPQDRFLSYAEAERFAVLIAESRIYGDINTSERALLKIMLGRELGIGPATSLKAIQYIDGTPQPSAGLMAALIKRSAPRYDFKVVSRTDTICELEFLSYGKPVGRASFSIAEAKRAELAGNPKRPGWQKYPGDYLFARALSRGFRMYTPDLAMGPVYVPEDFGGTSDGDVIDAEVVSVKPSVAEDDEE